MDEELRRAQRIIQRTYGSDEDGIFRQHRAQISSYLESQDLSLHFFGIAHAVRDLQSAIYSQLNASSCRNMCSRAISFLDRADLDEQPAETILQTVCNYSDWGAWFYLVGHYQTFVSKKPGTGVWSRVLAEQDGPPGRAPSTDGTTFYQRYGASMAEWPSFIVGCMLLPKYKLVDQNSSWYNWAAEICLIGYK